jgi:hypothetical protein
MADFLSQIRDENGFISYSLPAGSTIYRGDMMIYDKIRRGEPVRFDNNFVFFSVSPEIVEEYGVVLEFRTTRDYVLLALDNHETLGNLYNNAPPNIQTILERNYGYSVSSNSMLRYSVSKNDKQLSQYLCNLGYDGYATNTMSTDEGGQFHKELMICRPESIEFVRQVTTDETQIRGMEDAVKMRDMGKEMREKRRRKGTSPDSVAQVSPQMNLFASSNLFGSDSDDDTSANLSSQPPSDGKGGRRRKTAKRRKYKRKSVKRRRQTKRKGA